MYVVPRSYSSNDYVLYAYPDYPKDPPPDRQMIAFASVPATGSEWTMRAVVAVQAESVQAALGLEAKAVESLAWSTWEVLLRV